MRPKSKILLVDDDPDFIEMHKAVLMNHGYEVLTASNGKEGMKRVRTDMPDLIILDVQMPGKSGFDVFTELKREESTKAIPVIMLTGVEEKTGIGFSAEAMKEFLGNYPEEYIEKPFEAVTLQKTVTKLLNL